MDPKDVPGVAPGVNPSTRAPDAESVAWLTDLAGVGPARDRAVAALHDLLARAARREGERRRGSIPDAVAADLDDLARQAADDAVVAVLRKLPTYRGESRFTTWAWKFAVYEISVALRRATWRDRPIVLDESDWDGLVDRRSLDPAAEADARELVAAVREAMAGAMTPRQRDVFVAVVVDHVPIDVIADRLGSTRNATYKTLHDARARLRADLAVRGWTLDSARRGAR